MTDQNKNATAPDAPDKAPAPPSVIVIFALQDIDGEVRIDLATVKSIDTPTSHGGNGVVITLNKKSGYREVECIVKGTIASVVAAFAAASTLESEPLTSDE